MALPHLPMWEMTLPKALPGLCDLLPKGSDCLVNYIGCLLPGNKHPQTGISKQHSSSFFLQVQLGRLPCFILRLSQDCNSGICWNAAVIQRLRWLRIGVPVRFCFSPPQATGPRTPVPCWLLARGCLGSMPYARKTSLQLLRYCSWLLSTPKWKGKPRQR